MSYCKLKPLPPLLGKDRIEEYREIYAKIPAFKCKQGCSDCCGIIVFARSEWNQVKNRKTGKGIDCPYICSEGCEIYKDRPFLCRIFGASDDPRLQCPHGCKPDKPLTIEESKELSDRYRALVRAERR